MSPRGFLRLVLVVCAVLFAHTTVAALAPGAALADRVHAFSSAFGGGAGGSLSLAARRSLLLPTATAGSGIAVDDATHDLYVTDTGNHRIVEFTSAGVFVRAWGWGVADGKAELEVCETGCLPGLSGSQPGQLETPSYVAVDNGASSASKGDVYVGDIADNLVTKFDAEGHLLSSWGNNGQLHGSPTEVFNGGHFNEPIGGVSVDPTGNLWVFDSDARLFEFAPDGTWLTACTAHLGGAQVGGIVVSGSELDVLDGGLRVRRIAPECAGTAYVTTGSQETSGLAVDSSNGDTYVDREGLSIEDIPGGCAPSARGCPASQVFGEESALLGKEPPPPLGGATGLAVDPRSGALYAANTATQQIVVFGVVLEATPAAATGVGGNEATLHGSVNPEGAEASCVFEYGTTTGYGASAPCDQSPGAIGKGSEPVPVTGKLEGLMGGTTYHYRLHAASEHGNVYSEDETLQTAVTAVVTETTATELTRTSAVLQAKIDPSGLAATYRFEYGPCDPVNGCASSSFPTTVPIPDATIPAGQSDVTVAQPIEGLEASTAYHFRLVVTDANGTATTPETTFVDEPAPNRCATTHPTQDAQLPDCRAYEMVTPPGKDGALIDNGAFLTPPSIASDGSRVLAKSIQCLDSPSSCVGIRQTEGEPYSFQRTPTGWETTPLTPPVAAGGTMLAYNADTDTALYGLAAVPPAREQLYARAPGGTFNAIGPIAEATGVQVGSLASSQIATTPDLGVLVYGNNGLWPSLEGGAYGKTLFEYKGVGALPTLVAVTGPAGSTSMIGACGTELGGLQDPLSADGRTVFFTVSRCSGGTGENIATPVPVSEVYARIEQASGSMSTVRVSGHGSASECHAACQAQPPGDAQFQGASSDGSRVYFTSTQQLTDSASEDKRAGDSARNPGCPSTSSVASGCNLYELECPNHCENAAERHLIDVSAGDTSGLGPQVQGVVAISTDGSTVYFVAHGVLVGAGATGQTPVPGGENLYAYRSGNGGSGGELAFVATLAASDATQWNEGLGIANVTPDGRYLLFESHRGLTADTTRTEGPAQVYRYDAITKALLRVSIGRDGYNDNGNASTTDAAIVRAIKSLIIGQGQGSENPSMSDDGQFVFFESAAGLTPGALNDQHVTGNEKVLAENVYEWAADGAHTAAGGVSCETPSGCVSLISDGKDVSEGSGAHHNFSSVQLLGTDATGENVFFWTADQLVPGDTDSQVDLYDARVGGGFAERAAPPACEPGLALSGGVCRSAGSAPGLFGGPVSVTFAGSGNVAGETGSGGKPTPRGLTRAEKLKRAIAECRGRYRSTRSHKKRASCEKGARRRYRANTTVRSGRKRQVASRRRRGR